MIIRRLLLFARLSYYLTAYNRLTDYSLQIHKLTKSSTLLSFWPAGFILPPNHWKLTDIFFSNMDPLGAAWGVLMKMLSRLLRFWRRPDRGDKRRRGKIFIFPSRNNCLLFKLFLLCFFLIFPKTSMKKEQNLHSFVSLSLLTLKLVGSDYYADPAKALSSPSFCDYARITVSRECRLWHINILTASKHRQWKIIKK